MSRKTAVDEVQSKEAPSIATSHLADTLAIEDCGGGSSFSVLLFIQTGEVSISWLYASLKMPPPRS